MPIPNEHREYTYEDYLTWPEDERWEIIDGIAYCQATPSPIHQNISMNLSRILANYFLDKDCKVFAAPFTVRLPMEEGETDEKKNKRIVKPDLSVVCDKNKLDKNGYSGAPSLVIEIVSKSTAKKDNIIKVGKYERAGVKEYWIVTPETESIMSYVLNEQGMFAKPEMYVLGEDEEFVSKAFTDLSIKLKNIFETWI